MKLCVIGKAKRIQFRHFYGKAKAVAVELMVEPGRLQVLHLGETDSPKETDTFLKRNVTDSSHITLFITAITGKRGRPSEHTLRITIWDMLNESTTYDWIVRSAGHKYASSPGATRLRDTATPEALFFVEEEEGLHSLIVKPLP